jgi:hypothetical protein
MEVDHHPYHKVSDGLHSQKGVEIRVICPDTAIRANAREGDIDEEQNLTSH